MRPSIKPININKRHQSMCLVMQCDYWVYPANNFYL